jgi:hypothetical protein
MSGPIVRRYGFPNFENIFGKRDLQHGVDEDESSENPSEAGPAKEGGAPEPKAPPAPSEPPRVPK